MSWPLPQDFNEAVQFPRSAFSDPDLAGGEAVVGTTGLPLPRSGNFADVYQIRGADGSEWAIKCFTRPVTGLDVRYTRIGEALSSVDLPFTVGFEYLEEGVRVNGKWYPAVKMQWVEGLLLNQFIRENAVRPAILDGLVGIWSRLAKRVRECGLAHGDIQHGNVLLVSGQRSGSIGIKLIDYDGMYTPTLANMPSGEGGHSAYQHPLRAAFKMYSPDLDRFPHLVVATAMKAVSILGPTVWDKYDTGDNLLFTEADFKNPAGSDLFRELWQTGDPALRGLVGRLAAATKKPLTQTPWLDTIAPNGAISSLTPAEEAEAAAALGLSAPPVRVAVASPVAVAAVAPAAEFASFGEDEPTAEPVTKNGKRKPPKKSGSLLGPVLAVAGLAVIGGSVAGLYFAFGPKGDKPVAEATTPTDSVPPPPTQPGPVKPPGTGKESPVPPQTTPVGVPREPGATYQSAWSVTPPAGQFAMRCVFTADGKYVVVGWGKGLTVYDVATGNATSPLADHKELLGLVPLADGTLATQEAASSDAIVWNPRTGQEVRRLKSRAVVLNGVIPDAAVFAVHPGGRYVLVGPPVPFVNGQYEPREATLVDAQTGAELFRVPCRAPMSVGFTPDGKALRVAERGSEFRCRKYSLPAGTVESDKALSVGSTGLVLQASGKIDPASGRMLVSAASTNPPGARLCVFDSNTGGLVASFGDPGAALQNPVNVYFSPDGRYATYLQLNAGGAHELVDLDLRSGTVRARSPYPHPGMVLASSSDGAHVAVTAGKRFEVLKLGTGPVAVTPPNPNPDPTPAPGLPPDALDYTVADRVAAAPPGQKVRLEWTIASKPGTPTLFAKAVAFTPDESLVVLARVNRKEIMSIDTRTGGVAAAYTGHAASPLGVVVLANGQAMSVEEGAAEAVIWDPRTGKETGRVKCPTPSTRGRIGVFAASSDGRYVAAGARGNLAVVSGKGEKPRNPPSGGVDVIDTTTGKAVFTTDHYSAEYAFTPDGKKLVVAEERGRFVTYSVPEGEVLSDRTVGTGQYATVAALHPGLSRVVWVGRLPEDARMKAYVVNTDSGKIEHPVKIDGDPLAASLSPSGRHLFVAEQTYNPKQMTLRVTDLTGGLPVGSAALFNQDDFQPVNRVFVSPSGRAAVVRRLAQGRVEFFSAGGEQVAVRPPDVPPTGKPPTVEEVAAVAEHYALDPQPVPAVKGKAPLWATLTSPEEAKVNDFPVNGVAFTGDGRSLLLTRSGQTPIAVLDVRTGRVQTAFVGHTRPPLGVGVLPNGRAISQEPDSAEAVTWDPASGREIARVKSVKLSADYSVPMQVSPNGRYLLFCKRGNGFLGSVKNENPAPSGVVVVVDLQTGTAVRTVQHYDGLAAFSPDSRKVIFVDKRARVFTHDIEAGTVTEKAAVTDGEWGSVGSVSPAAGRAVWFGAVAVKGVNAERVIDLASGKLLEDIPPGEVSNSSGHQFLPDGRWLAYSGARGQTKETWFGLLDAKNNYEEAYRVPLKNLSSQTGEVALSPTGGHALVYRSNQNRLEMVALGDPRVAIAPNPNPDPNPTPNAPDRREAVPADEKLAKADAEIREVYKAEFAKKTPEARKALAVKLLDLAAKTTDDPVTRYALLRTGQTLASEAGDVASAVRATDAIAAAYAIDTLGVKAGLFEKFGERALSAAAAKDLVEVVSATADAAAEQDGFETVVRLNQLLGTLARKGGFPVAVEDADARISAAKRNRDLFKSVQPALDVLATKPTDAEANLTVGRFRCFVQARWEAGAAFLARGDHPQLKAAGALEAKAPTDSPGLGQLADAWWEAASAPNVDPAEKKAMESHARTLYIRALPGLTGLSLAKAESRTEFTVGGVTYAPGLVAEFSAKRDVLGNKKNRVDPTLDFDGGEFSARDGYSTDIAGRWTGVIVPPRPGRYKLVLAPSRYVDNGRLLSRQTVLIDPAKGGRGGNGEVVVTMGDKPFPITVEMPKCWNLQGYKFQLKWAPAVGNTPETVIPAEYLFHDKKAVKK